MRWKKKRIGVKYKRKEHIRPEKMRKRKKKKRK